jgi:hypothetical protein
MVDTGLLAGYRTDGANILSQDIRNAPDTTRATIRKIALARPMTRSDCANNASALFPSAINAEAGAVRDRIRVILQPAMPKWHPDPVTGRVFEDVACRRRLSNCNFHLQKRQ